MQLKKKIKAKIGNKFYKKNFNLLNLTAYKIINFYKFIANIDKKKLYI